MISQTWLLRLFFIWGILAALTQYGQTAENVLLLEDFESGKLSQRWTAFGKIGVERTSNESATASDKSSTSDKDKNDSLGMFARCDAQPNSKFLVNQRFQRPPYERYDTIRFRIRSPDANEKNPLTFEFQVFSQERPAALWRKFTLNSDQWTTIELPMQHFRYTTGASLDWAEVSRFGVHFRDTCHVALDDFELVASEEQTNPYFTPDELATFAFGDAARVATSEHFAVITNDERVDHQTTLQECEKLHQLVARDFPDLPPLKRKVPVLIFSRQPDYQRFWSKLGGLFVSQVPPVRSNGYSLLGVAGTFYSDKFGPVRPVLIHEACHAMLAAKLGVSNSSEWLHEGLANYYQLNWTNQDIHTLNRSRFANGRQLPLAELLDGQRIRTQDYAQATLFVKWLLEDKDRKRKLSTAFKAMRERNSTKFEPLCAPFFQKTLPEFEREWMLWAKRQNG